MSRFLIRGSVSFGILALILTTTPARGEQGLMEEVIVTASKREQSQLDVPLSVQTFGGATIEEQGIYTLDDIIRQIPGGISIGAFNTGTVAVHMRGSGGSSVTGESTIGYYVDETAFSVPNIQLAPPVNLLYDLERVEILRGPQGTLYGQGSMGGTIKYVSRKPDLERFTFKAQANGSNTDGGDANYRVDAVANMPIVEDTFGIRLLVGYDEEGGFGIVPDADGDEGHDSSVVRLTGLLRASENLDINFSILNYGANQEFLNFFSSHKPPSLGVSAGFVPDNGHDTDIYSLVFDWDLGFANLISSSSTYDTSYTLSIGGGLDLAGIAPGIGVGVLPFKQIWESGSEVFTQELRLVSNSDGPVDWIVGGFFTDSEQNNIVVIDVDLDAADPANPAWLLGAFAGIESDSKVGIDSKAFAFFGEISIDLLDGKLVPLVGARYFEDDRSTLERFTGVDATLGAVVDYPVGSARTFDNVSPRFNLSYYPNDATTLYANAAMGFRSGTQQLLAQVAGLTLSGIEGAKQMIDPDEVWTYELGAKREFADGSLVLQGAVYLSDWEDLQSLFTTVTGINSVVQLGDIDIFGVEWDLLWRATDSLLLGMNGAFTESEFADLDPVTSAGIPQAEEGNDVPFTPKWTANVFATYSRPIGGKGLNSYAYLGYSFRSSAINYTLQEGSPRRDMTLRLGVQGDQWSVYLYSENLLNQDDIMLWPVSTYMNLPYPRKVGLAVSFDTE